MNNRKKTHRQRTRGDVRRGRELDSGKSDEGDREPPEAHNPDPDSTESNHVQDGEEHEGSSEGEPRSGTSDQGRPAIQSGVKGGGGLHSVESEHESSEEKAASGDDKVSESSSDHIPVKPGKRFLIERGKLSQTHSLGAAAIQSGSEDRTDIRASSAGLPLSLRERAYNLIWRPRGGTQPPVEPESPSDTGQADEDPVTPSLNENTGEGDVQTGKGKGHEDAGKSTLRSPDGTGRPDTDEDTRDHDDCDDTRAPTGDGTLGSGFEDLGDESDEVFENGSESGGRITSPFQNPAGFQFDKRLDDFHRAPRRETIYGIGPLGNILEGSVNNTEGPSSCRSEPTGRLHMEAGPEATERTSFCSEPNAPNQDKSQISGNFLVWSDRLGSPARDRTFTAKQPEKRRSQPVHPPPAPTEHRANDIQSPTSDDDQYSQPSYDELGEPFVKEGQEGEGAGPENAKKLRRNSQASPITQEGKRGKATQE